MSSGSSRADSAVEPTRSTSIKVSRRRSASGERPAAPWARSRNCVSCRCQCGDGSEQLAAMSDRADAQRDQIVGGKLAYDAGVDVICSERRLVLAQPQPAQPSPEVHSVSPTPFHTPTHAGNRFERRSTPAELELVGELSLLYAAFSSTCSRRRLASASSMRSMAATSRARRSSAARYIWRSL